MRESMIIVRRDIDAQRAREGLPPATNEEFDDEFDRYIEELEASAWR